ncbi:unnamed protein product [Lactuca saligna]|uniref:CASP-like protein n=1 Tax=Lactuca saligna TaxID=75948 RepID=A0AA35YVG1_LACSI|nr:unnamed protein product [Lactuca saligna]
METENVNTTVSKLRPSPSPVSHFCFTASQIWLRIVAAGTSIAAACLMFNSRQSKVLFGTDLDARYTYNPSFKFFTIMNVVASVLSLLSLLPVFSLGRKFSNPVNYFFLFIHDLILTSLMVGGFGAAAAIAQVGKYGNNHAGWMPICDNFGKFCHKVMASLILSFLSTICYLLLTVISANKAREVSD